MASSGDLSLPTAESINPAASQRLEGFSSVSEADLVFTQNVAGQYLSFYWKDSQQYGLQPEQVIGQTGQAFAPVAPSAYLERLRQVLDYLRPIQLEYPFVCEDQYLVFDLTLSPILMPQGTATTVVGTGQFLYIACEEQSLELVNAVDAKPSRYYNHSYNRLNEVVWNIRRTLDLNEIWQQTVNGLGEALGTSRCLICPYQLGHTSLKVIAEYRQPDLPALLDTEVVIEDHIQDALATCKPVLVQAAESNGGEAVPSVLAVATCYQDQPNGLILLHRFNRRLWSEVELDLLIEIASQVGTGIAHALLLEESRSMAVELQRMNENLMQQHSDLEEARQQAEAASRHKSEFLANTSHELRTPLNGIIGFLNLIIDGMADDPAEQNQFLQEAHRSAIHLLDVINDILDIAKIEAGKMQLDLNPIRLDELLIEVENFTRPQAQQKHLSFEIRTPDTRDEVILYGNYQRLLQVMLNLVGNAIKFTHEGSITISAEVIPEKVVVQGEEKPGIVKISVADTGIGVSLEKQDKLFQSFSQVDSSRTRQYGGTGLGLAISQKLVEAMGGVVNFFSMGEGLGSTVTFTVPLYQDPVMVTAPLTDSADLLL